LQLYNLTTQASLGIRTQARPVRAIILTMIVLCNEMKLDYLLNAIVVHMDVYFFLRVFCLPEGTALGVGVFCTTAGTFFCPTVGID
jgi:hypothetical protein